MDLNAGEYLEEEDDDCCRICRLPAEQGRPLYHPCKCSGSIRHVHEACLSAWLKHSGHRSCEVKLCLYSFDSFYIQP